MSAVAARPYEVPRVGGSGRALLLAVLVHALLGALLYFGVHWQSSPPEVMQAELWSATPQTAAPTPRPIPPPPKVEPPVPETKVVEPPPPKADIVEKAPAKVEPKPKPPPPVQKVEPPKPKVEPVKQPPKEAPARPPSDLANILASAHGPDTSTGKDQQTSGPRGRDSYIARLVTAIRSQMRYPANSPGNPTVKMRIEQLPTGEVTSVTVTRASGVPTFDDAVDRAIRAASPLPRDEQGKPERVLNLDYQMYEKN